MQRRSTASALTTMSARAPRLRARRSRAALGDDDDLAPHPSARARPVHRKTEHSVIERRRREKINERLVRLQTMVPACRAKAREYLERKEATPLADEALDERLAQDLWLEKLCVISHTVDYIEELRIKLDAYAAQCECKPALPDMTHDDEAHAQACHPEQPHCGRVRGRHAVVSPAAAASPDALSPDSCTTTATTPELELSPRASDDSTWDAPPSPSSPADAPVPHPHPLPGLPLPACPHRTAWHTVQGPPGALPPLDCVAWAARHGDVPSTWAAPWHVRAGDVRYGMRWERRCGAWKAPPRAWDPRGRVLPPMRALATRCAAHGAAPRASAREEGRG